MSFAGTWNIVMNTPMGAQNSTLTLAAEGAELTGKMVGTAGSADLKEGKIDGSKATWKASLTQPFPITLEFSAAIDGDAISGTVKLGAFGESKFTGNRA